MERSAVITGIGVILPGIRTKEDLWASQSNSSSLFRQVSKKGRCQAFRGKHGGLESIYGAIG